jgi:hypothetical protein
MNITPYKRDENGLLTHIEYPIKEDNTIDWLKLAPAGSVYIKPLTGKNRDKFIEKYQKEPELCHPIEDKIEDKYLAVTLAGLRAVSRIRGFNSIKFDVYESGPTYCSVKCIIEWIPNYLTEGRTEIREDCASVIPETTNAMTRLYYLETAANRAEARCIRNSLLISIVSREELQISPQEEARFEEQAENNPASPKNAVLDKMKKMGFTSFKEARVKFEEIGILDYKGFETLNDVPGDKMMGLMMNLNKLKK